MKRITWQTVYALSTYPEIREIMGLKDEARHEALLRLIEHTAANDNGRPMDMQQAWEKVIRWSDSCTFVGYALKNILAVRIADRAEVFGRVADWMSEQGWDGEAVVTPWAEEKILANIKIEGVLRAGSKAASIVAICQLKRLPAPKKQTWRNFGFRAFAACAQSRM